MYEVPEPEGVDPDRLDRIAKSFTDQKHMTKTSQEREEQLKQMIKSMLEDFGQRDENGHVWLPGHDYMIKHEARKTVRFNSERAEEYLKSRDADAWEKGTTMVPEHRELTEDSFSGYMFEHAEEGGPTIEDFFDVSTSWAVKVTQEEQVEY
jgi:hypothetical protein